MVIIKILAVFLFLFCASDIVSYAATISAASVSYSDVSTAVSNANQGDTVVVPAGTATWNTPLVITIPISLIGAGSGSTIITGSISATDGMVTYSPPSATDAAFRLSGFTLDSNETGIPVKITSPGGSAVVRNVRVDNNILIGGSGATDPFIRIVNTVFGVVDNNTAYGKGMIEEGDSYYAYDHLDNPYGTEDNFYFEDNVITHTGANFFTSGHGSSYAARYNTLTNNTRSTNSYDVHGNMKGPVATNVVFEGYGNHTVNIGFDGRLAYVHGGKNLIFYNKVSDGTGTKLSITEFFNDGLYHYSGASSSGTTLRMSTTAIPTDAANVTKVLIVDGKGFGQEKTITARISSTVATMDSAFDTALDGSSVAFIYYFTGPKSERVQHINDSYFWGNRRSNGTLIPVQKLGDYTYTSSVPNSPPTIVENREWWQDNESYNGITEIGVFCGSSLPESCTVGDGAWITDQSCSDLSGLVGKDHTMNITGVLYKCISTNTWEIYYTPYTYPHPLREGEISSPTNLILIVQ